ncbi:hypothetical protein [Nostoc sp. KVJ3]|uniref:hypothetical protein n=1 Tax=Nostoc sp. KVJ3 TaxID=457945 RepID=UPI002237ED2D|nr:hypothetical protein [Nostoc sp. KVJ3]
MTIAVSVGSLTRFSPQFKVFTKGVLRVGSSLKPLCRTGRSTKFVSMGSVDGFLWLASW